MHEKLSIKNTIISGVVLVIAAFQRLPPQDRNHCREAVDPPPAGIHTNLDE
jgi:hypothetical protein